MDETIKETIEQCAHASHEGKLPFPEVLQRLSAAGVESYHVDYRARRTTYHTRHEALSVDMPMPTEPLADGFSADALQEAIRGSQRGEVKYPEFVRRSLSAGCAGYTVFLAGAHVCYVGRRGEQHVEHFPSAT